MLLLISKARAQGMVPIVTNCYSRADYTPTIYEYVKQMNHLINSWDVPSVNLLGAIDNGAGQWPTGYQYDANHPNDLGHAELFYSVVPSLFDALDAGKLQPKMINGTSLTITPSSGFALELIPEEIIHPFTITYDLKTTSSGVLTEMITDSGNTNLTLLPTLGTINYTSAKAGQIKGHTPVNDGKWHKVTLTHYYAWGKTFLYIDSTLEGSVTEKIVSHKFTIGGLTAPSADYRNFFFYRSAINSEEVAHLTAGKLLQSSLEIYSPLDAQKIIGNDTLINIAQCLNKIKKVKVDITTPVIDQEKLNNLELFPNPVKDILNIRSNDYLAVQLFDSNGNCLNSIEGINPCLDLSRFAAGVYFVKASTKQSAYMKKIIKLGNN